MARIIVADDEPTHLELVSTILERAGHEVVAVTDGKACLNRLQDGDIDLVVTDVFMPALDGFQLMAAIRDRNTHLPVIGMTGGMRGHVIPFTDIMARLGARSVLTKPFSREELLAAVQSAMGDAGEA
ncbi:CheY-like receiver [Paramagnetospirillum caucaseum]|uniref:CheY-like receiver n=1 Tax=Paramagnetospirillum caucaseum TaxID=1244869 RepID=M2Z5H0_9PROT|nr:response regulator [Paramagnetospirillum caucaseum]EME69560.1 CheY-like receiver [Paramagnetospirillum caucaseum]